MIQDRVLKIIKGLNTFSSDDIVVMTGFEEPEVSNIIAGFINAGTVIKTSADKYNFVNKMPTTSGITPSLKLNLILAIFITFYYSYLNSFTLFQRFVSIGVDSR